MRDLDEYEELISKTGGIVQGMSGSPIIQNGKLLVGAVTKFDEMWEKVMTGEQNTLI